MNFQTAYTFLWIFRPYYLNLFFPLCSWFEWDAGSDTDDGALSVKSSERLLKQLEDVGQQLALTFNNEGSLLAVGGEVNVFISTALKCNGSQHFLLFFQCS